MAAPDIQAKQILKILIIDNNEYLTQFYNDLLSLNGYITTIFNNSLDALAHFKLRQNHYDLILSGVSMPNMKGDKLAVEILKLRPDIPIILCSGFHPDKSIKELMNLGIRHFLSKPVDNSKLLHIINELKLC